MPGKPLCIRAQEMVLNVLEYFETEKKNGGPFIPVTDVLERVAGALKISRTTVSNVRKRKKDNPILPTPGKKKEYRKPKTKDLPQSVKLAIRDTLFNMYKEGTHVTLQKLNEELRRKEIVCIGKTSLHKLVREIGFKYKKVDKPAPASKDSDDSDEEDSE